MCEEISCLHGSSCEVQLNHDQCGYGWCRESRHKVKREMQKFEGDGAYTNF
jgi:hypothetical protein